MNWQKIEDINSDMYAMIGNGEILLSKGACKLISDIESCNNIDFYRAKKNRVTYLGIRFSKEEKASEPSEFIKNRYGYGAIIHNPAIIHSVFGEVGSSDEYTKKSVCIDDNDPNLLIICKSFQSSFVLGEEKRPVRKKHVGAILNEEWLILSSKSKGLNNKSYPTYHIRNIHNGMELDISTRAVADIEKGLTTVDNILKSHEMGVSVWRAKKSAEKRRAFAKVRVLKPEK